MQATLFVEFFAVFHVNSKGAGKKVREVQLLWIVPERRRMRMFSVTVEAGAESDGRPGPLQLEAIESGPGKQPEPSTGTEFHAI